MRPSGPLPPVACRAARQGLLEDVGGHELTGAAGRRNTAGAMRAPSRHEVPDQRAAPSLAAAGRPIRSLLAVPRLQQDRIYAPHRRTRPRRSSQRRPVLLALPQARLLHALARQASATRRPPTVRELRQACRVHPIAIGASLALHLQQATPPACHRIAPQTAADAGTHPAPRTKQARPPARGTEALLRPRQPATCADLAACFHGPPW
jgi:hypothetical protein